MKLNCAFLTIFIALVSTTSAADQASDLAGDWRGESLCAARNTACHDESVVFHLSIAAGKHDAVSVRADKIVNGQPVNMGTLQFRYIPDERQLVCEYPQGIWRLQVSGEKMEGTLTRSDKTLFRRVTLHKE
jgi:hypothetical protein